MICEPEKPISYLLCDIYNSCASSTNFIKYKEQGFRPQPLNIVIFY